MDTRLHKGRTGLVCCVISFLLVSWIASVCGASPSSLSGFRVVADNVHLTLYINDETTEIAVEHKSSGQIWRSNPTASSSNSEVNSQLVLSYYAPDDNQRLMDSFKDSVQYGQFEISDIDNGVRVEYSFGREWMDEDYVPALITKERFETLLDSYIEDESDKEFVLGNYVLVSLEESAGDSRYEIPTIQGIDVDEVFGSYRLVSVQSASTLPKRERDRIAQVILDTIVRNQTLIENRRDLKYEDLNGLRSNPTYLLRDGLWAWDIEDMVAVFRSSGLSPEQLQGDYEQYGLDKSRPNICVFEIPIEYRLDGEYLVVTVPVAEAEYPVDVLDNEGNEVSYLLGTIDILPYFGAGFADETGYMLVPDGSGALIHFKQGSSAPPYVGQVYGEDSSVAQQAIRRDLTPQIHLPLYGIRKGESAFLAIIEEGASLARIRADVARDKNGFNRAFNSFTVISRGLIQLRGSMAYESVPTYAPFGYEGDFTIRYGFVSGERATYVGMAELYQRYLESSKGLHKVKRGNGVPLFLEVAGAIDAQRPVLGVSTEVILPMTRYSDLNRVLEELCDQGIGNIKARYTGWLSGGIRHVFPVGVKLESALGSRRELIDAISSVASRGVDVYLDVSFQNIYRDSMFDGFSRRRDSAYALSKRDTRVYDYSPVTLEADPESFVYVLSPRKLEWVVDRFMEEFGKLGFAGISVADVGTGLHSDMSEDPHRFTSREESLAIIVEQLKRINPDYEIMLDGVNSYALPYATHGIDVPLGSSKADIIDQDVPFLQMVLHGYVNLSGRPLNLCDDVNDVLLRHIEMGMYPHYVVFYEGHHIVKDTPHDYLFAGHYQEWMSDITESYRRVDAALRGLEDQRIVDHWQVSENVYQTVFENGTAIVVNYGSETVMVGDVAVPGKDFTRFEVSE